jgi:hypothetical protein
MGRIYIIPLFAPRQAKNAKIRKIDENKLSRSIEGWGGFLARKAVLIGLRG